MPGLALGTAAIITQLARELRTVLDQRFASMGLTSQQAGIVLHVSGGERSPRRLAELLATDTAGMTRLLDRLVAKGLVARGADPADRRSIRITLTTGGEELAPRIPPIFGAVAARLADGIGEADLATTQRALLRMQQNLADAEPGP